MSTPDRKSALLAVLAKGIAALTTSQGWHDWLQAQSRFPRYSFHNVLLIGAQDPQATRVAGFHTWKSLGRVVRKGERAIWIMAPMTRMRAGDSAESGDTAGEKPGRVLSGFKPVPVFDVRQTEGDPLPEIACRLTGPASGRYRRLVEVAHSIGYTVEQEHLAHEVNGDCAFALRRIRIEPANDEAQQVKTLAHELAHALLHEGVDERAQCELEAESVAFVVCAALGIDSARYSFGYLAAWAGGGSEAIMAVKSSGERIQRTADRILRIAGLGDTPEVAA